MSRLGSFTGVSSVNRRLGIGRDPALLAVSVVLPRLMGLVTLPIYTRLLGPDDFGRFELLISIIGLFYAICLLGLDFAISVRFFGFGEDARRRDAASALAAAAAASVTTAGILVVLAGVFGTELFQSADGGLALAIAISAGPFNALGGVLAMYLRLKFRGVAFFRAMLGGALGGTITGVALVVVAGWGLLGAVVGLTVVHALTFALLAFGVRGLLNPYRVDRKTALRLVRLGAPLVPAGAASWVFSLADRFFVAALLGFTQLGLYASAARLATVLAFVHFGFHAAWGPLALRWVAAADRDRRYRASLRLIAMAGGACVAIVSWLARPLLELIAGPAYVDASSVVWLLAAAVLFTAMFPVAQMGASLGQRGGHIARTMIAAAALSTVANLLLIPTLGYVGAGGAALVTSVFAYALMYGLSQRVTRIGMGFGWATAWALTWTLVSAASVVTPSQLRPAADIVVVLAAVLIAVREIAQAVDVLAHGQPGASGYRVDGDAPTRRSQDPDGDDQIA